MLYERSLNRRAGKELWRWRLAGTLFFHLASSSVPCLIVAISYLAKDKLSDRRRGRAPAAMVAWKFSRTVRLLSVAVRYRALVKRLR